jgi:hypothetical protein
LAIRAAALVSIRKRAVTATPDHAAQDRPSPPDLSHCTCAPVRLQQLLAVTLHEPCRTSPWSQARVAPPSSGRHQGRLTASAQPLLVYTHSPPSTYHWNVGWRRSPIANNSPQSCAVSHDCRRRPRRWLACSDTSVTSASKGCGGERRTRRVTGMQNLAVISVRVRCLPRAVPSHATKF